VIAAAANKDEGNGKELFIVNEKLIFLICLHGVEVDVVL
jgi:hypothetical protein